MVSASDWLLLGGGTMLGSLWAWDVKLEPNLCFDGSAAVLGMGVKVSLWTAHMFLSSLGLEVWQAAQMRWKQVSSRHWYTVRPLDMVFWRQVALVQKITFARLLT